MVDVVVDQVPAAKLPYDPDVIPPAVRKRAAAVDALYASTALASGTVNEAQTNGSGEAHPPEVPKTPHPVPEATSATPQEPVQPVQSSPTPAPSAPADQPPPPEEDENSQTWKHRALAMQGRYQASQKEIGALQEQMTQMGNELMQMHRRAPPPQPQRQPPPPAPAFLTENDVQQYGNDLLDVAQRAALHVVAPHMQRLESENEELRQRVAKESRRALDMAVASAVPNYMEIDRDPRWHRWLLGIDVLSGRVRQQLLDEAISAAQAPRVISFFRGFLNEEAATGHSESAPSSQQAAPPREPVIPLASLAAPGRVRPATGGDASLPPEKPIYTRPQLRQLYEQHRRGAYVGREAEWARIDADIIAAGREGRIR